MGPQADAVLADVDLPREADIVVVGGGIVGVSVALTLAQRGISVVLCEKGTVACEQSSRNWGWVRQARRDPRELPLALESRRMWEGMERAGEIQTGFRRSGILFAAEGDDEAAGHERWLEHARPFQIDARMVSGAELDRLAPGAGARWKGALYCATDGRAEPQQAAPAIARAAQRAGATILTGCAVRGLDLAGGRIAGVVTERGRIRCAGVIVAGGAWSRRFLEDVEVTLPQLKVRASVLRTAPLADGPDTALWCRGAAYRRRADGGYTVADGDVTVAPLVPDTVRFAGAFMPAFRSERKNLRIRVDHRFAQEWRESRRVPYDRVSPYERTRVLDPSPDRRYPRDALERLAVLFPMFAQARVVAEWAGMIDVTPDAIPVISAVDQVPGLVVATGFSGHGFGVGPAAGRLAAELATNAVPVVDPRDFRLSRFTDGPRPRPTSGV